MQRRQCCPCQVQAAWQRHVENLRRNGYLELTKHAQRTPRHWFSKSFREQPQPNARIKLQIRLGDRWGSLGYTRGYEPPIVMDSIVRSRGRRRGKKNTTPPQHPDWRCSSFRDAFNAAPSGDAALRQAQVNLLAFFFVSYVLLSSRQLAPASVPHGGGITCTLQGPCARQFQ